MPKRILLADDSITIQKVVELTFSDGDYEVVAVNNGAKAIQKIAEMKPDVILSDIIMPEKNGYEVCEFVKSHPVYRGIPVILLTGTFEPFDPDRADKAGCDAVVTKPFESQSLIAKVEELIQQSSGAHPAEAAAEPAQPDSTPWDEPPAAEPPVAPPQFETARSFNPPSFPAAVPEPAAEPPSPSDFFASSTESAPPTSEMPYADSSAGGETRAFPRMPSFDEPQAEPEIERSPWDQAAASGGETRAFPKMSYDDLQRPSAPTELPEPGGNESPWDEGASASGGETRAIPQMSFDDLAKAASSMPHATEMPEPSPWDEQPAESGETRAFPKMSFNDLQAAPPAAPATAAPQSSSPWDEQPAESGETRAFPKMSFGDLPAISEPEPVEDETPSWKAPSEAEMPSWSSSAAAETNIDEPAVAENFSSPAMSSFDETPEPEPPRFEAPRASTPEPAPASPAPAASAATSGSDLSDEQVDRIARRVVQMLSDQVVRNIAWEVIPDLAEMVVKERIRQLESEP